MFKTLNFGVYKWNVQTTSLQTVVRVTQFYIHSRSTERNDLRDLLQTKVLE